MNFLQQMSSETTTKWMCNIKKNLTSRFSYSRWDSRGEPCCSYKTEYFINTSAFDNDTKTCCLSKTARTPQQQQMQSCPKVFPSQHNNWETALSFSSLSAGASLLFNFPRKTDDSTTFIASLWQRMGQYFLHNAWASRHFPKSFPKQIAS